MGVEQRRGGAGWIWILGGLLIGVPAGMAIEARDGAGTVDTELSSDAVLRDAEEATGKGADVLIEPEGRSSPLDGSEEGRSPAAAGERLASPPGDVLFTDALLALAAEGVQQGWASRRSDEMRDDEREEALALFEKQTLETPPYIGVMLADRRSAAERALEDAERGGAMDLLKRLEDGESGPFFDLVRSDATFDKFFVPRSTGGRGLDGVTALSTAELSKREPVADGSTLQFPAGVFQLEDFGTYWRDHFPRDLTIRGAGKGATLLVLRQDLSAYDAVHNLTIERVTLHTNNHYLFDVRREPMTVTLKESRFTGWGMGAGASCLFGTEGLALRAMDCEFAGGYGRHPGHGQLFDIRHNGLLARFERCTIERTQAFESVHGGSTIVFSACQLRDVLGHPRGQVPGNVLLDGSTVQWFDGPTHGDEFDARVKRDLNDLFPNWKQQLQR